MSKTTKIKRTKTYTGKSIGPKFCAVLLIFVLAIFALISNLVILKTVRDEMKTAFDSQTSAAVSTLASSVNAIYDHYGASDAGKALALQVVENATWNDERHFWAASSDYTEILAGQKDYDEFFSAAGQETKFGFSVWTGYTKAHFNTNAYPKTEEYIRASTAVIIVVAIFALGACVMAFYRSSAR